MENPKRRCSFALILLISILFCFFTFVSIAAADVLVLPASLYEIDREAFYGDESLNEVVLPEGIKRIESLAFASSSMQKINLPSSLEYIADDAIDSGVEVIAEPGTMAYNWAVEKGLIWPSSPVTDFTFLNNGDGTSKVEKYIGNDINIVIPRLDENGNKVTGISDMAFYGCSSLASVIIPDSVTSIGDSAFLNCTRLISITIPDSVTSIGNDAFYNCRNLSVLYISSISSWLNINFADNYSHPNYDHSCSLYIDGVEITNITIPDSVTCISDSAFRNCSSLSSITIPDSVTSIGADAFANCSSLPSITIPAGVNSIGDGAFHDCRGLTSITIPDSMTSIGNYVFEYCSSLASITIPDSVTSIGNGAFSECTSLTTITIPDSVTIIGKSAFGGCDGLTSINIPASMTSIDGSFCYCASLKSITIPSTVTTIGTLAFRGCSSLTNVIIPDSVTSIGNFAFNECISLTSITIPDSVTSIGWSAFSSCCSLSSVIIPDSVTSIGNYAFSECTSLTTITIPDSVTSIGTSAFYNCSNLKIFCLTGSCAELYAQNNNISYQAYQKLTYLDVIATGYQVSPGSSVVFRCSCGLAGEQCVFKFELYKDGVLVDIRDWDSFPAVGFVLEEQGDYIVTGYAQDMFGKTLQANSELVTVSITPVNSEDGHDWDTPYTENDQLIFICKKCGCKHVEPVYSEYYEGIGYALVCDDGFIQWYKEIDTDGYLLAYYEKKLTESELTECLTTYKSGTPDEAIVMLNDNYIATEEFKAWNDEQVLTMYNYKNMVATFEIHHRFCEMVINDFEYSLSWDIDQGRSVIVKFLGLEPYDVRRLFGSSVLLRNTSYHNQVISTLRYDFINNNMYSQYDGLSDAEKANRLRQIILRICEIFDTDINNIYINMDSNHTFENGHTIAGEGEYHRTTDNMYICYGGNLKSAVKTIVHELRHSVQNDISVCQDLSKYGFSSDGACYKELLLDNFQNYWKLEGALNDSQISELNEIVVHNTEINSIPVEWIEMYQLELSKSIRGLLYCAQPLEADTFSIQQDVHEMLQ